MSSRGRDKSPKATEKDERLDESLLRRDGAVEERLDPALVARLETWFGSSHGSASEAEDDDAYIDPVMGRIEKNHEAEWRRARAAEVAASGALLGQLEKNADRYRGALSPRPVVETKFDSTIARFDLTKWGVRTSGAPTERTRPEDIGEALNAQTPQALLRDLHRPIPSLAPIALDEQYLAPRTGAAETAEIKQLVGSRYAINPCEILRTPRLVSETMAELRQRLDDEPWADCRPEKPQPFGSSMPNADLMKWFG